MDVKLPDFPIKKLEKKIIIDKRNFKPHEIKESEMWSWSKLRNEKWFIQLDCVTKKLNMWALQKSE